MRVGRGGRTESSAPTGWDVGDAVPYTLRHCEEYPKGTCFAARSDAATRSPQHKETDSRAGDTGGQRCSTLRRFVHWQFTFHIGRYSVSIRVMKLKSRNRHSAK